MSLNALLGKWTPDDKKEILRQIVILPMIEEDKSMSQEELGDVLASGKKLGLSEKDIRAEVQAMLQSTGAVLED